MGCSAPLPFVLLRFLSLLGDFGTERGEVGVGIDGEKKKGKESETPRLAWSAEAALCLPVLLFHLETRQRGRRERLPLQKAV